MTIVFIGAGNLATRLASEMHRVGMTIGQVYSRTEESASTLAKKLNSEWTTDPEAIIEDADLYIFSLKDAVLQEVISRIRPNNGLWVHTAGSMPMDIFKGHVKRYGVFYPLQTFSKGRTVNFEHIPIFLELSQEEDAVLLQRIATALTDDVQLLSSEKRRYLHLAAVFASNFTNHMYALAGKILEEQDIPIKVLLPLIDETANKVHEMKPALAQTGPAVRYDENVIGKQLAMLTDPDMKAIYELVSQSIHKQAGNE